MDLMFMQVLKLGRSNMKHKLFAITSIVFFSLWNSAHAQGLTLYSASGEEILTPILQLFEKQHPDIKISQIHGGAGELMQRIKAESKNPSADVLFGGPIQSYETFSDYFEAYETSPDKDKIIQDPNNIWHAFSVFAQPLIVNTQRLQPSEYPKTIDDIIQMDWDKKGGIVLADPNQSGTGYTIVSGLVNAKGWDEVGKIIKKARITPGSTAMFNAVKDGEATVGWINEDLGTHWVEEGLDVALIYPQDAVTVQVDAYGLVKGAKNPKEAKVFIDFLGSTEVQSLVSNVINRRAARTDIAPPSGLPELNSLPIFTAEEPAEIINSRFTAIANKK